MHTNHKSDSKSSDRLLSRIVLRNTISGPDSEVPISIYLTKMGFLEIRPDGYGEKGAIEGYGAPVYLEVCHGRLMVRVSPDINSEEVMSIDLEGARETARRMTEDDE